MQMAREMKHEFLTEWKNLLNTTEEASKALLRWRAAVQKKFSLRYAIDQYAVVAGVRESKEQFELMHRELQELTDLVTDLNGQLMQ